jgi:hypothetical protein
MRSFFTGASDKFFMPNSTLPPYRDKTVLGGRAALNRSIEKILTRTDIALSAAVEVDQARAREMMLKAA